MIELDGSNSEFHLETAVDRTRGIQPWRRIFHAWNGTAVVLAVGFFGMPVSLALQVLGGVLAGAIVLDLLRLMDPKVNILFFRTFSSLASPRERKGVASSTWYALSAFLVLLIFPRDYALTGILVLAWADPAASIVGQLWGRTRFMGGSLRGTGTFIVVAFLASLPFIPWQTALITALVTGVVEALPVKLDDNLLVPIVAAGLPFLMGG